MDDLLLQFKEYLIATGVAYNTRKNYTSDLSTFVDYLNKNNQYFSLLTLSFVLSDTNLENYKLWLLKNSPLNTVNRRLSSIRKFGRFAIEKNLIDASEMGTTSNVGQSLTDQKLLLLEKFKNYLISQGNTPNTISGYLSDIRYYMGIRDSGSQSLSSIARRQNSVNKFEQWRKDRQVSGLNTPPDTSGVNSINTTNADQYSPADNNTNASHFQNNYRPFGALNSLMSRVTIIYHYLVENVWVTATAIGLLILTIALIFLVSRNPYQDVNSRSRGVQGLDFSQSNTKNSNLSLSDLKGTELIDPTETGMATPVKTNLATIITSLFNSIFGQTKTKP
jgi:hypothetical protein